MYGFFDFIAPIYDYFRPEPLKVFHKIWNLGGFERSDRIVDLGGGTGAVAKLFVGRVQQILVIDPSQKMIERCRKNSGLSCIVGGGESLPLESGTIDKIILVDAFHHIPNQLKTAEEIKRVLKKDGRVIIAEYNPEVFGGKLIVLFEKMLCLGSVFHAPSSLESFFTDQGFRVQIVNDGGKDYFLVAKNV